MAFVVHDDARLEPGNLGLIAAGGLAHVFAPRAFVVKGFGRLAGLPQVDAAANTVVVVKELLADQTRHVLESDAETCLLCSCHCSRVSHGGNLKVTTAVIIANPPRSLRLRDPHCEVRADAFATPVGGQLLPQKKILQDEFPIAVSKRRPEPGTLFRRHESLVRLRL